MWVPAMYASCSAAIRSNSARLIVCLVALVESSTMNVDRVLRESTRALTFTLPNSVTEAFGIFSVSSRSRSAEGFHSTDAAFTCCPTVAPPPGHGRCLAPVLPAVGHARLRPKLRDLGSVPGKAQTNAGRVPVTQG